MGQHVYIIAAVFENALNTCIVTAQPLLFHLYTSRSLELSEKARKGQTEDHYSDCHVTNIIIKDTRLHYL